MLGKIADKNPAVVLPHLRQVLKKVICDLQSGATLRIREGGCQLVDIYIWFDCHVELVVYLINLQLTFFSGAALSLSHLLKAPSLRNIFFPFLGVIIHALPIDPFLVPTISELDGVKLNHCASGGVYVKSLRINPVGKDDFMDNAVLVAGMRALGNIQIIRMRL